MFTAARAERERGEPGFLTACKRQSCEFRNVVSIGITHPVFHISITAPQNSCIQLPFCSLSQYWLFYCIAIIILTCRRSGRNFQEMSSSIGVPKTAESVFFSITIVIFYFWVRRFYKNTHRFRMLEFLLQSVANYRNCTVTFKVALPILFLTIWNCNLCKLVY